MKKSVFISVFLLSVVTMAFAQQKFNVQNGTKTVFYSSLEEAIQQAASGDTIYLPGALINTEKDIVIDKKLALIGAGCDTDSIGGLKRTEIQRIINFRNGSTGSLLTGCVVNGISFGHRNDVNDVFQDIQNITISRNLIQGTITMGVESTGQNPNKVSNVFIQENIIDYINGIYASDCWINNNLIKRDAIRHLNNSYIYNNVIYNNRLYALHACTVENNYIYNNPDFGSCSNSSFNNNAFREAITFPSGTNTGVNNLISQETIKTFVVNNLDLPKNLEIRVESPCKNAGTDGADIGIFGGTTPYKKGAAPFTPHIDKSIISAQTDVEGKLKVEFKVSAQDR